MSLNIINKIQKIDNATSDAHLVFVNGPSQSSAINELDKTLADTVTHLAANENFKAGELKSLLIENQKAKLPYAECYIVKLNSDKNKNCTRLDFAKQLAKVLPRILAGKHKELSIYTSGLVLDGEASPATVTVAEILGRELLRADYRYETTLGKTKTPNKNIKVVIAADDAKSNKQIRLGINNGIALAKGINCARELGNLPGNYCAPRHLGDIAKEMANNYENLTVKVLGLKAIERLKMGSFLSVARGSAEEPRFIVFEYKGKASTKPNVLVGKGITFDTGGISLKPGAAMDEMKFDMCGAASVFGTITALAEMKAKAHVVGIVAAAENMPSGTATKPGDVVTSMSGQTIEVLNTDAEGRLVLCDALTYAERFKPKSVVDIATLTGACIIALGNHTSGLFSNDQKLADKLLSSGEYTGDRAWQLPIWEDYHASLKSNFADMANIGGREAGSITAACFLSKFTKAYPWAHLDIAGSAWKSGSAKGATGRPVELLVHYLLTNA